jgi:hypothetical protein
MFEHDNFIWANKIPDYVLKTTGIKINRVTAFYWMTKGRKASNGERIVLKFVTKLGRKFTKKEWLDTFIRSL